MDGRIRIAAVLLLCSIPPSGCRLFGIKRATEKTITVEATPAGSMVILNGLLVGTAPCKVVLPRSGRPFSFEVLPPRTREDDAEAAEHLYPKRRTMHWSTFPSEGGVLYFDLRLEPVEPTQPIEIRNR